MLWERFAIAEEEFLSYFWPSNFFEAEKMAKKYWELYHIDISIEVAIDVDFNADTKIDVVVSVDDDVGNIANFDGDEDAWWSPPVGGRILSLPPSWPTSKCHCSLHCPIIHCQSPMHCYQNTLQIFISLPHQILPMCNTLQINIKLPNDKPLSWNLHFDVPKICLWPAIP